MPHRNNQKSSRANSRSRCIMREYQTHRTISREKVGQTRQQGYQKNHIG